MQDGLFDTKSLEQVVRDIGRRWGAQLKARYLASGRAIGSWPGTLDEARRLVDAAAGRRLDDQERELMALLVERGARLAWHSRVADVDQELNPGGPDDVPRLHAGYGPMHAGTSAREKMPYASKQDLPAPVRRALPWDAQVIFRKAFNRAFEQHHGDEATAFRIAWGAVKRDYDKVEGHWLPRWVFEG